jgi:hypothetical protein
VDVLPWYVLAKILASVRNRTQCRALSALARIPRPLPRALPTDWAPSDRGLGSSSPRTKCRARLGGLPSQPPLASERPGMPGEISCQRRLQNTIQKLQNTMPMRLVITKKRRSITQLATTKRRHTTPTQPVVMQVMREGTPKRP